MSEHKNRGIPAGLFVTALVGLLGIAANVCISERERSGRLEAELRARDLKEQERQALTIGQTEARVATVEHKIDLHDRCIATLDRRVRVVEQAAQLQAERAKAARPASQPPKPKKIIPGNPTSNDLQLQVAVAEMERLDAKLVYERRRHAALKREEVEAERLSIELDRLELEAELDDARGSP